VDHGPVMLYSFMQLVNKGVENSGAQECGFGLSVSILKALGRVPVLHLALALREIFKVFELTFFVLALAVIARVESVYLRLRHNIAQTVLFVLHT
jgi:hypothetical protein